MIVNESDEERRERLRQYRICQERGHDAGYGLGSITICGHCGVSYQYVLKEEMMSLPTGVTRAAEGGYLQWQEMALPPARNVPEAGRGDNNG